MSRPRFHRLPVPDQDSILDAALLEFSRHGFAAASLNRIIEAAGLSKGAMYYYFDGKADLYEDVVRRELGALVAAGGVPSLDEGTPDAFWASVEDYFVQVARQLAGAPGTAALLRDWLADAPQGVQREAERALLPGVAHGLALGQRAGAVRTDLPDGMLLAVAFGIGQAMDQWLLAQPDSADLDASVRAFTSVMRRALQP